MGRVAILHTGGTLGMRPQEPDKTLAPDEFGATVLEHVPELSRIADIDTRVLFNLDSSDLGPEHWMRLAEAVAEEVERVDGVVVTHGTDAMAYTASALSYVLRNLPCPVILTGSQRPLADARTDGRANLVSAADLAQRPLREVAIYFDGVLLRGNRAIKSSSFEFGAFSSPNHLPLARVGTGVQLVAPALEPEGPFRVEGRFDPRVAVVWLTPGQDGSTLRSLADGGTRAVMLVAFGAGNVPVEDRAVAGAIGALVERGLVVAIGSQAPHGRVDLEAYAGGRLAKDMGAVGIRDMTLEAATVKLMYLLGTLDDPAEVRRRLTEPIAGEVGVPS